jgi:hypothetical protein
VACRTFSAKLRALVSKTVLSPSTSPNPNTLFSSERAHEERVLEARSEAEFAGLANCLRDTRHPYGPRQHPLRPERWLESLVVVGDVSENIHLPLQGLDYGSRVERISRARVGYFEGLDILPAANGEDSYGVGCWSDLFGGFLPQPPLLRRRTTKRLYFWPCPAIGLVDGGDFRTNGRQKQA